MNHIKIKFQFSASEKQEYEVDQLAQLVINKKPKLNSSINKVNSEGLTPLEVAAFEGDLEQIKEIVNRGGKITQVALNIAIRQGKEEVYRYFLEKNPTLSSSSNNHLDKLVKKNRKQLRNKIKNYLNGQYRKYGWCPINYSASLKNNPHYYSDYLKDNPHYIGYMEVSTMQNAIATGNLQCVKALVNKGFKLEQDDLFYAVSEGNNEMIEYIIDKHPEFITKKASHDRKFVGNGTGFEEHRSRTKGLSPVEKAFYYGNTRPFEILKKAAKKYTLKYAQNHINTTSKEGLTGLEIAAFYGDLKDIKDIHAKGGKITQLALNIAIRQGKKEVYTYLLKNIDHLATSSQKKRLNHLSNKSLAKRRSRKEKVICCGRGDVVSTLPSHLAANPLDMHHIENSGVKNAMLIGDIELTRCANFLK